MAGPDRIVAGFAAALRAAGLSVPTGSLILFTEALGRIGMDRPERVYWAGRATLVRRFEDIAVYDRVFGSYWGDVAADPPLEEGPPETITVAFDDDRPDNEEVPEEKDADDDDVVPVRYSAVELLKQRDLSGLTASEWEEARRLISALRVVAELRPSRRKRPTRRRSGRRPDLRQTMRRNLRRGGVPVERAWKAPVDRPRRIVFLLDISGSMDPYARALARFAHAAVSSRRGSQVEVFAIGTRLTRITRELRRRDPDAALSAVAEKVPDWSGGTRIGSSLQEFNDRWGVRGLARGAIVVICSDGWDRGEPELVGAEMARLRRVARRLVWVNPLKASPGYAPLARGMAAALPYVDQFIEGHAVESLERLADALAGGASEVQPTEGRPRSKEGRPRSKEGRH